MKTLILALALFAVAQAAFLEPRWRPRPVPMNWIPVQIGDRIVGGSATENEKYKYQISLQRRSGKNYYHSCGGSIIGSKWVITAAHCVSGTGANKLRVAFGIFKLSETKPGINTVSVSEIISHSGYDSRTLVNDIALLRLASDIGTANVISVSENDVGSGDMFDVTGWGALSEGGPSPDILHEVQIPYMSNQDCASYLQPGDLHTDEMFCAAEKDGGIDSCQGDSGGPVARNGQLVGLVSWGYGCARPQSPGVYTRVYHYRAWINSKMSS